MKTINVLIKTVARDLSVSEQEVKQVLDFYWKYIKDELIEAKTPAIYIKEIGTLSGSGHKVRDYILKTIQHIRLVGNYNYSLETIESMKEGYRNSLRKALYQRNLIAIREYNERYKRNTDVSSESDQ